MSAGDASSAPLSRRRFLQVALGSGGWLVTVGPLAACSGDSRSAPPSSLDATSSAAAGVGSTSAPVTSAPAGTTTSVAAGSTAFRPNPFVRIGTDGAVTFTVHRSEMGQGIHTSLAMLLADELAVDLAAVHVESAMADKSFGSQTTGGSGSMADNYATVRRAGAVAREVLVGAAAQAWGVDPATCTVEAGQVVHAATARRRAYGDLVELASLAAVPTSAPLRDRASLRLVGTSVPRLEGRAIGQGAQQYGIDVRVPAMVFAAVARCPVPGGRAASFAEAPALAVAGVTRVLAVPSGVAVLATNTWAALRGSDALDVQWDDGANASWSTASIAAALDAAVVRTAPTAFTAAHQLEAVSRRRTRPMPPWSR